MATITADTCSYADVSAAIALASSGDTVSVPAGSATWSSQLLISKGISLIGAGAASLTITAGTGTTWLVKYAPPTDQAFRLSGFTFDLVSANNFLQLYGTTAGTLSSIRIDNNSILNARSGYFMETRGKVFGVIDNNTMTGRPHIDFYASNALWNTEAIGDFGSANCLYLEDNTITSGFTLQSCGLGGRVCWRHNTITATDNMAPVHDMHGNQPTGNASGFMTVLYENTVAGGSNSINYSGMRGGKSLIYNNAITTTNWANLRYREEYNDSRGIGPEFNAISGEPQHVHESYSWNNTKNGTLMTPGIAESVDYSDPAVAGYNPATAYKGVVPQADRDFFYQVAAFDGSSGVGVGLLEDRPATCALEGAAYWATDEAVLYRWHDSAWETYYVPYTYPHPLRGGAIVGFENDASIEVIVTENAGARLYAEYPRKKVVVGNDATYTVHAEAYGGFTGNITLDVTGLPANATDSYGTNPMAYDGKSVVTIGTAGVAAGTYSLYITGTSEGADVATVRVVLVIVDNDEADIRVPIRHIYVKKGDNAVYTVQANPTSGYTQDIDLSVSGVPSGATSEFGATTIDYNGQTTLTIDTGTAAAGEYKLDISGVGPV